MSAPTSTAPPETAKARPAEPTRTGRAAEGASRGDEGGRASLGQRNATAFRGEAGAASSRAAKSVMVLVLFAVIAFAVAETVPWYRPVGGGEDPDGVAEAIFERYVVAFEVLGVLLTAALLGAMYLAIREASP